MPLIEHFDLPTEEDCYAFRRAAIERYRQQNEFGDENHAPALWLTILTEEVGEVAGEVLRIEREGASRRNYQAELEHVAAVALAALACSRYQETQAHDKAFPPANDERATK